MDQTGHADAPVPPPSRSTIADRQHRLGRQLAVHQRLAGELAGGGAQAQHLDLVADLVAGHHRPAEPRPLDRR